MKVRVYTEEESEAQESEVERKLRIIRDEMIRQGRLTPKEERPKIVQQTDILFF